MVRVNVARLQSVLVLAVFASRFLFIGAAYGSWSLVPRVTLKTTSDYVINSSDSHCCFSDLCVPYRGSSSTSFLRSEIQLLLSLPSLHPSSFAGDPLHLMPEHRPQLTSSPLLDPERLESKSSLLDALFKVPETTTPDPDYHCRLSPSSIPTGPSLDGPPCLSGESCASLPVCLAGRPDDSGELNVSTYDARCFSVDKTPFDSGKNQYGSVDYGSPPTQATTTTPHIVVMLFTLRLEMVSTISDESFASGPRLLPGPIKPFVRLQPRCRTSFNTAETIQGSNHLLDFGLFAESSVEKFSFKVTTPPKIGFRFDMFLVNCRSVSVIYCVRVWIRLIFSLLCHCCVSITLRRLKHRRFFTEVTSHPFPHCRYYCARVWMRQIFTLLCLRCASITIRRLKHRRFFTDSVLQSPSFSLIARATVQECGFASSDCYYNIAASPLHYAVSSIDGSSQCDPFLGAAIVYGGSQTSCYQNPLVGFFNVDFDFFAFFRMQALGLQVKLLYGSLLSLATSILRYVLIVSVYLFTFEDHSGCNRLSPWGV
uniref:Uncharacterized protein n=1 Tax=Brassica campestris TaxID=3711 RepID=M4DXZ8_BRACM